MKKSTDNSMFYGAEPIIFEYAKTLRKVPTRAERVLWKHLNKNKLGVKVIRFTNSQVLSNIESVLNQIKNEIFLLK